MAVDFLLPSFSHFKLEILDEPEEETGYLWAGKHGVLSAS